MHSLIKYYFFGLLFLASFVKAADDNGLDGKKVFDANLYDIHLVDFSFDARQTEVKKVIACTSKQVESGLKNIETYDQRDTSIRRLEPSFAPLSYTASWLIDIKACPSLTPTTNGLGFSSFDQKTGIAELYLAQFTRNSEIDTDNKYLGTMGILKKFSGAKYDYDLRVYFNAKCEMLESFWSSAHISSPELICNLENDLGFVRFKAIRK